MASFRNISIKKKLILIQSLTAFVALVLCAGIFVINDVKILKESSLRKMNSIAQIVGENSIAPLVFEDKEAAGQLLGNLEKETDIRDAILVDKEGKVFARYTRTGVEAEPVPELPAGQAQTAGFTGGKLLVIYKLYQPESMAGNGAGQDLKQEFVGTIVLRAEISDLDKIIGNYLMVAGLVLLAGLLAAVIISLVLQRTISSRLRTFVARTREVSETGNYKIRVDEEGKDEIAVLAREFNAMLAQIEEMARSLKQANLDLENKVQERTLELSSSNNKLLMEISERRKAEEVIKNLNVELEKKISELEVVNKELESFSYTVSHDLRAPLRAINGFTKILMDKYRDQIDSEGHRYLNMVADNAGRMGRLIDDLLAFSRLGKKEVQKEKVNTHALVESIIREIDVGQWNEKARIIVKDLAPADGDRSLLQQVFYNLISNALKYSKTKPQPLVEIGSVPGEKENIYYVKDNGVGFDMQYYNKLFKVFQRLHSPEQFEGLGIGLAIVHKIVSKHGGRAWAEGKVNEGATFYFSVPNVLPQIEPEVVHEKDRVLVE